MRAILIILVIVCCFGKPQMLLANGDDSKKDIKKTCLEPKIDWNNYQWILISGSGCEACEEMLAYLKSLPADQPPPVCPDERLPPNKNWKRPESRILSQTEQQTIIDGMPIEKPWIKRHYETLFRNALIMRVIKADITRDGVPELLLAYPSYSNYDYRESCVQSTKCAHENRWFKDAYKYSITLMSDATNLLPMTSDGKQVDWNHRTVGSAPMLMLGELVFYKGLPYWLSSIQWDQATHDDFRHSRMRPNDPYSAIFTLVEISTFSRNIPKSKNFKDITDVSPKILNPLIKHYCRFGYLHRDNIKLHSHHQRR